MTFCIFSLYDSDVGKKMNCATYINNVISLNLNNMLNTAHKKLYATFVLPKLHQRIRYISILSHFRTYFK